jgi:hypothetical protein
MLIGPLASAVNSNTSISMLAMPASGSSQASRQLKCSSAGKNRKPIDSSRLPLAKTPNTAVLAPSALPVKRATKSPVP